MIQENNGLNKRLQLSGKKRKAAQTKLIGIIKANCIQNVQAGSSHIELKVKMAKKQVKTKERLLK